MLSIPLFMSLARNVRKGVQSSAAVTVVAQKGLRNSDDSCAQVTRDYIVTLTWEKAELHF